MSIELRKEKNITENIEGDVKRMYQIKRGHERAVEREYEMRI